MYFYTPSCNAFNERLWGNKSWMLKSVILTIRAIPIRNKNIVAQVNEKIKTLVNLFTSKQWNHNFSKWRWIEKCGREWLRWFHCTDDSHMNDEVCVTVRLGTCVNHYWQYVDEAC